jgi:predicted dehydrogenase
MICGKKKYRIGLAGTGYVGSQHLKAIKNHPRATLCAVATKDDKMTKQLRDEYGINVESDFNTMAENSDIDIIIIATPNELHADHIKKSALEGKHILCEKPLIVNEKEVYEVVSAVENAGVKLEVGHVCRFSPYYQKAKQISDSTILGEIRLVESTYIHRVSPPLKSWWKDTSPGSMAVLGGACHSLDLLRWAFGEIKYVSGGMVCDKPLNNINIGDTVICNLKFESGCVGRLYVSLSANIPYSIDFTAYGTLGSLICNQGKIQCYSNEQWENIEVEYIKEHPYFLNELDDLINAIDNDISPKVSVRDGANTVLACLAVLDSINGQGKKVNVRRI